MGFGSLSAPSKRRRISSSSQARSLLNGHADRQKTRDLPSGVKGIPLSVGTYCRVNLRQNLKSRRIKKHKKKDIEYFQQTEYSALEEAPLENIEALAKALAERGIPITRFLLDYELDFDEEDALIQATKILIQ